MRLTRHTDYALRILLQAAVEPEQRLSIAAVASAQAISRNHAMKVVNELANGGFLATARGRGGGFQLARPATEITLGDVVRLTEPDIRPADCENCMLGRNCGLIPILGDAVRAFMDQLDKRTLAEAVKASRLPFPLPPQAAA